MEMASPSQLKMVERIAHKWYVIAYAQLGANVYAVLCLIFRRDINMTFILEYCNNKKYKSGEI